MQIRQQDLDSPSLYHIADDGSMEHRREWAIECDDTLGDEYSEIHAIVYAIVPDPL